MLSVGGEAIAGATRRRCDGCDAWTCRTRRRSRTGRCGSARIDEPVAVRLVDVLVGIRAVSIGEEVPAPPVEAVDGEWRLTPTRRRRCPPRCARLARTSRRFEAVGDTLPGRRMQLDVVDSPTWALRERHRAIMWNADRVAQLLLLLAAHGEERAVSLVAPGEWLNDVDSCAGLAVSVALGQAMLRYVYPSAFYGGDAARHRPGRATRSRVRAALAAASGSSAPVVVPPSEAVLVTGWCERWRDRRARGTIKQF